jgi:hypothetical protein
MHTHSTTTTTSKNNKLAKLKTNHHNKKVVVVATRCSPMMSSRFSEILSPKQWDATKENTQY